MLNFQAIKIIDYKNDNSAQSTVYYKNINYEKNILRLLQFLCESTNAICFNNIFKKQY